MADQMREVILTHSRYRRERGICPACDREMALSQDRRIPAHDGGEHNGIGGYCDGWGGRPKDNTVYIPRAY